MAREHTGLEVPSRAGDMGRPLPGPHGLAAEIQAPARRAWAAELSPLSTKRCAASRFCAAAARRSSYDGDAAAGAGGGAGVAGPGLVSPAEPSAMVFTQRC